MPSMAWAGALGTRPLGDDDGQVRELTAADMRRMKPAAQVLDPKLYAGLLAMNASPAVDARKHPPSKSPPFGSPPM